jgi:hypothetical protein
VRGRPDRHAAALTSAIIEICREPGASASATFVPRESRVFNGKGCLPLLEPDEFVASGEDVRCEQGDVFERPRQQRRDHTFRHAWREILAGDEAIARYVGTDPTRPWFDLQSGAWQVGAVGVEVENHFEQESNNGGTTPVL